MRLRDYSLASQPMTRKSDIDLTFDDSKAAWSVKKLTEYKDNKPAETKLQMRKPPASRTERKRCM